MTDYFRHSFGAFCLLCGFSFGCSGTPTTDTCSSNAVGATSGTNACATGGATATGGTSSLGGSNTGALASSGGTLATGGSSNIGGTNGTGGLPASGGTSSNGGSLATGGMLGTGGSTVVAATGTLGQPCSSPGQLACASINQKLGLVCGASYTWEVNQTCNQALVCDSRPGGTAGTCQTPDADCVTYGAGTSYCIGKQLWACDPWGIKATQKADCSANGTCTNGACVIYKPGTKNVDDPCYFADYNTNAKVCNASNPKSSLKCNSGLHWVIDTTCSGTDICDSPPGTTPGICHPPDTDCAGHAAGEKFCKGDNQTWTCNAAGTTASWQDTCGLLCYKGACIAQSACPSADIVESCSTNCPSQDANACVSAASSGKTVTICPTASGTQIAAVHINPSELTIPSGCSSSTTQRGVMVQVGGSGCPIQNPGNVKIKVWPYLNMVWAISPSFYVTMSRGLCNVLGYVPNCTTTTGADYFYVWSSSGGTEMNLVVEMSPDTLVCP